MLRLPRTPLRTPQHPTLRAALVVAPLTALALSACGGTEPVTELVTEADARPATGVPSATVTADAPRSPASSPTRTPGREPTLVPIPPQDLVARPSRSHLLAADRLPRLARDLAWARTTDEADGTPGEPVGACQRASLVDIGALDAVRRTSETADGSTRATQVVARFPDRTSTWRAHEVLRSWRGDCAEQLGRRSSEVGAIEAVPVPTGHGEAYAAAYRSVDAGTRRATGLGILRKGSWLVVVEIATDADRWPAGWDPTRKAVRRIAATFEP